MSIGWFVLHILLNFYDAAFNIFNISDHLKAKPFFKPRHRYPAVVVMAIIFNIINFSTDFSLISGFAFFAVVAVFFAIFYQGEWHQRAFWVVFVYTILMTCDHLGSFIVSFAQNMSIGYVFQNNPSRFVTILLCRFMTTSAWVYLHKNKRIHKMHSANIQKILIVICFFLASLSVVGTLRGATTDYSDQTNWVLSVSIAFTFVSVLIFFIATNTREKKWKKTVAAEEAILNTKRSQLTQSYQFEVLKAYKAVRKFESSLLHSFQQNWPTQNDNGSEVKLYFEAMTELSKALKKDIETGDSLVDIVISIKSNDAFRDGIVIEACGELTDVDYVSSDDICIILDCLLSEAVDYVRHIQNQETVKNICVLFTKSEGQLEIKLEYPISGQPKNEAREMIHPIVLKYKGDIVYTVQDGFCEVAVNLLYPDFVGQNINILRREDEA